MLGRFDIRVSPLLSCLGSSVGDARRLPFIGGNSMPVLLRSLLLLPQPLAMLQAGPLPPVPAALSRLMAASFELSMLPLSLVVVCFVEKMGNRDGMDFDSSSKSLSFHVLP